MHHLPLLDLRDRAVVLSLAIGWLLGTISLWVWWLRPDHWVTMSGMVLTSLLLAMATFQPVMAVASFARSGRAPRRDTTSQQPRIAMVVTKAPGEPWSMLEATLFAMGSQDTALEYDIWLADEAPDEESVDWCWRNGIRISTRQDVEVYHRRDWPRRTRSKEGNLAYFYDHWGYDLYDVVCQFDADHAPTAGYLEAVMDAFADPTVGYVAAPSICDANVDGSWAARGRLYSEATLHGIFQAGHSGLAPSCIGSHYAVRTQALYDAGGLGPELAEDFSTSFLLNRAGWQGAFAIDAIAHGDGPESFADAMVQEMQWARSLATVFLEVAPPHWRSIPWVPRVKLAYALLWYPYMVTMFLGGWVMVHLALVTGVPWVDVPIVEMLVRVAVPSILLIAMSAYIRSRGWLRPVDAKIVSWERALYELTRWPWVAIGLGQALAGFLSRRVLDFRLTPKGGQRPRPLNARVLIPYALLAAVPTLLIALYSPVAPGGGYVLLETFAAVTYLVVLIAVVVVHRHENVGLTWRRDLRNHAMLLCGLTATFAVAVSYRFDAMVAVATRTALFPPSALLRLGVGRPDLGPSIEGLVSLPVTRVWMVLFIALPLWMWWCRRRADGPAHVASTAWVRQALANPSPARTSASAAGDRVINLTEQVDLVITLEDISQKSRKGSRGL